tara:strand:+ start:286 stop:453 length:168 start_codon:yes stop_codon:yes gene_type:complete
MQVVAVVVAEIDQQAHQVELVVEEMVVLVQVLITQLQEELIQAVEEVEQVIVVQL